MIFTDSLVQSGIGNIALVDKNKHFLKYEPPKMEKSSACDSKIQMIGQNDDQ